MAEEADRQKALRNLSFFLAGAMYMIEIQKVMHLPGQ